MVASRRQVAVAVLCRSPQILKQIVYNIINGEIGQYMKGRKARRTQPQKQLEESMSKRTNFTPNCGLINISKPIDEARSGDRQTTRLALNPPYTLA